jgi:hypothetical protein
MTLMVAMVPITAVTAKAPKAIIAGQNTENSDSIEFLVPTNVS